jgi:hypothetical protein
MRFTVIYTGPAEQDLAAASLAGDRGAVADAADRIDRLLATDPLRTGESRVSSVSRVGYVTPLGFTFYVVVDDAVVYVTAIWLAS